MTFILSKVLIYMLKPIIWVFGIFVYSLFCKSQKRRRNSFIAGLIVLFIFSNGYLLGKAFNFYEGNYPPDKKYDIGIVLGGFSGLNVRNNEISFNASSDRLFQAVRLYKEEKIGKILITSGSANLFDDHIKEANLVSAYLKRIGISDTAIIIENQSRNTIENASLSFEIIQKLAPKASILVITSAYHIPRSRLIFSKYFKNQLEFYPTDFFGSTEYDITDIVLPKSSALFHWELLIKEWVGLLVDRFRI